MDSTVFSDREKGENSDPESEAVVTSILMQSIHDTCTAWVCAWMDTHKHNITCVNSDPVSEAIVTSTDAITCIHILLPFTPQHAYGSLYLQPPERMLESCHFLWLKFTLRAWALHADWKQCLLMWDDPCSGTTSIYRGTFCVFCYSSKLIPHNIQMMEHGCVNQQSAIE